MAENWQASANKAVDNMLAECATHERRKVFYAKDGDGVQRAQALIAYFQGLAARLQPLIRSV